MVAGYSEVQSHVKPGKQAALLMTHCLPTETKRRMNGMNSVLHALKRPAVAVYILQNKQSDQARVDRKHVGRVKHSCQQIQVFPQHADQCLAENAKVHT